MCTIFNSRVAETEYDGVREEKFSDKASVSSTESKSIENAFEEYYSSRPGAIFVLLGLASNSCFLMKWDATTDTRNQHWSTINN